jgi:hypothetical protein
MIMNTRTRSLTHRLTSLAIMLAACLVAGAGLRRRRELPIRLGVQP